MVQAFQIFIAEANVEYGIFSSTPLTQTMRTPEEVRDKLVMLRDSLEHIHYQKRPTGDMWQITIASLETQGLQHELVGQVKALLWALGEEWEALETEINGLPH